MKKTLVSIIAFTILLTGYCPSILSNNHGNAHATHQQKEFKNQIKSSDHQMNCCKGNMPELQDANLNRQDQIESNIVLYAPQFDLINYSIKNVRKPSWNLVGHNSSPPHLNLTGSTIMRN